MPTLVEDDTDYSVIGKEAPSTCEYLENEKVLHWIKDTQMPKIDEECVSICSGETTNVDMLNLVYGGNSKADNDECGSNEDISISKNPYLPESIIFGTKYPSVENSPTTSNGYVKVDIAVDGYYCEHSSDDKTQTTSTTSYDDHYGAHVAPSLSNDTANNRTISESCNTGGYCDYEQRIQDYNQTTSTTATSLDGSYIDHESVQMGFKPNKNHPALPLTIEEPTSMLTKDCCDIDDLPYVALSEDMLDCSLSSAGSTTSPATDLDYSAYNITTESNNNSMLHARTVDYIDDAIAM